MGLLVDTPERMAELHPPIVIADLCSFEGACGSPLQRCPVHQADIPCMLEHDPNIGVTLKPGFAWLIHDVETGEKLLSALRWCWANGCSKERPHIEMWAAVTKARITEVAAR